MSILTEEVYEKAKERFDYNPLTGNLLYIEDTMRNKIGDVAGYINDNGYVIINVYMDGGIHKQLSSHRLAFYIMEGYLPDNIDHVNGARGDNRWFNLRECTKAQNNSNVKLRVDNTSGYRGVSRRRGNWLGQIRLNSKNHSKSGFKTPELANEWVVNKSKELYGSFYNEERN